jgi:hypothetical protein
MKKAIDTLILLIAATIPYAITAQFSGPNASTYNPNTDKYYITNYYGKNVVSIDANSNKATFITGLNAPNNILYADLPIGAGYIILDSNEIKGYDDAGVYYASFSAPGAQKFQDVVFDSAGQCLYISDVKRGVIYKTTFGPAPFYLPSTSIFSSPFRRPSAMVLQKKKNRIIYVEDTLGGNLMAVDLSNGNSSTVKNLNMDNLVGLAEDGQQNLYISSQGLKAIYQLNKYYTGNPVKLYSEPKPADLLVNPAKDQWVYTCITCGTVFTPKLHIYGPGLEIAGCVKSNVASYRNFLMKNIGTFDPGNQFIMEMSNSLGSFQSPKFLASVTDTLIPDSIAAVIPNVKPGNYKYRWRSTKPATIGSTEILTVYAFPLAEISSSDSIQACLNSTVSLGKNHSSNNNYSWSPAGLVDTASNPMVEHKVTQVQTISVVVTSPEGCTAVDTVVIMPVGTPSIPQWNDSIQGCKGAPLKLGAPLIDGLTYVWSKGEYLDDSSIAQPLYTGDSNLLFTLKITAAGGCYSMLKQQVLLNPKPKFSVLYDTVRLCGTDATLNGINSNLDSIAVQWIRPTGKIVSTPFCLFSNNDMGGITKVSVTNLRTGCTGESEILQIINIPISPKMIESGDTLYLIPKGVSNIRWFRNDTLIALDSLQYFTKYQAGTYTASVQDSNACGYFTSPLVYKGKVGSILKQDTPCSLFPNPAQDIILLNCTGNTYQNQDVYIFNPQGILVLQASHWPIDISQLASGVYLLYEAHMGTLKIIKE